jgi:hypothetical protein
MLIWNPAAVLPALTLLLASVPFVPASDPPLDLHGECIYPPAVVQAAAGSTFVPCRYMRADAQGVSFRLSRQSVRFSGTWDGARLDVTAVTDPTGRSADAEGTCRIDYANEAVSLVSCTVLADGRRWLANFRKSPL